MKFNTYDSKQKESASVFGNKIENKDIPGKMKRISYLIYEGSKFEHDSDFIDAYKTRVQQIPRSTANINPTVCLGINTYLLINKFYTENYA